VGSKIKYKTKQIKNKKARPQTDLKRQEETWCDVMISRIRI